MDTTKNQILKKIIQLGFLATRGTFVYRVCKLMEAGEFDNALESSDFVQLLNEGPGKNIKTGNLKAQMEPLLREGIVGVKISKKPKRKLWFPAWINKGDIDPVISTSVVGNKTLFVSGAHAWTDSNKNLPQIIKALQGELRIVDPFYGNGTLVTLSEFGKDRKIRFLSAKLGDEEQKNITKFDTNLKKFKSEFKKNVQLRKYNKYWELHDRYIIADNALVVVGYGIKDFGSKESFVIFLPKKQVSGFLPFLRTVFEKRWRQASNIA